MIKLKLFGVRSARMGYGLDTLPCLHFFWQEKEFKILVGVRNVKKYHSYVSLSSFSCQKNC